MSQTKQERRLWAMLCLAVVLTAACATAGPGGSAAPAKEAAAPPPTAGKATEIGPVEAYRILQADQKATLLDVRTQAEYFFVGHPAMAVNIPSEFWDENADRWSKNPDFESRVLSRLPKDDAVVTMCRSGRRSKKAAERLVELGYIKVYNMLESFEGDTDPVTKLRTVNGWKNRGLPYTYDKDPKLIYQP